MSALKQHTCLTCGAQLVPVSAGRYHCPCCGNNYDEEKQSAPIDALLNADAERMSANFSKAETLYQRIIQAYPNADLSDAYWGLFLCEQRCMFESEENDTKRFPSFYDIVDRDVQNSQTLYQAIACAESAGDFDKANIYRELAKSMAESKKKYNTIKETAAPYDVFICFKKSRMDGKGDTVDLKLARNIYNQLCKDYNVFFSEESLSTIVVRQYEPNIYYALYTAKVMLVLCSDIRYINAKWVKNEWSRFIQMAKTTSEHKTIIPIFNRDFTAEKLPYELRSYQGLNRDENLIYSLKESIGKIVNPEDKDSQIDALLERMEDLQSQVERNRERPAPISYDARAYAQKLRKEAKESYEKRQYTVAMNNFKIASEKDPYDYYSKYMLSECDVSLELTSSKLIALIKSTLTYAQSYVEDKSSNSNFGFDFVIKNFCKHTRAYISHLKSRTPQWSKNAVSFYFNNDSECSTRLKSYQLQAQESFDKYYKQFYNILPPSIDMIERLCPLAFKPSVNKITFEKLTDFTEVIGKILEACEQTITLNLIGYDKSNGNSKRYYKQNFGGENEDTIRQKSKFSLIQKYIEGMVQYEEQHFIDAYHALKDLDIYNSKAIVDECNKCTLLIKYKQGIQLSNEKNYPEARDQFKELGNYLNSEELVLKLENLILKTKYQESVALLNEGKYEKAETSFKELTKDTFSGVEIPENGYLNSKEMADYCRHLIIREENRKKVPLTAVYCTIILAAAIIMIIFGSIPQYLYMHISFSALVYLSAGCGVLFVILLGIICFMSAYTSNPYLKFKKIPVFICSAIFIFGLIWLCVFGQSVNLKASNLYELQTLIRNESKLVELTTDIDCKGQPIELGSFFHLDGKGHTIKNISLHNKCMIDMFSGSMENLTFRDISITYEYPARKSQLGYLFASCQKGSKLKNLKFYDISIPVHVFNDDNQELDYCVLVKYIHSDVEVLNIYIDEATCAGMQLYYSRNN